MKTKSIITVVIRGGNVYQVFAQDKNVIISVIDLDQMDDIGQREEDENTIKQLEKSANELEATGFNTFG